MNDKSGFPPLGYPQGNAVNPYPGFPQPGYPQPNPPNGYPGPPEYVEQGFPMQPSYPPPPIAVQSHGMNPYGMPIMNQPLNPYTIQEGMYMENPPPPINTGDGDPTIALNFLKTVSSLQIRQKIEMLELVTGFETENRYVIYNESNQPVFYAVENSNCCTRQCCGPQRSMEIRILDLFQTEIIHLHRPLRCQSICCPCCLQTMEVTSPPGSLVSTIEQCWSLWPKFEVNDEVGNQIFKIKGPFCTCSCGQDVVFHILSANDDSEIGKISKKWSGFGIESFTDADNFGITFPVDLDVKMKAALIGAVFLVDMMYFEQAAQKRR